MLFETNSTGIFNTHRIQLQMYILDGLFFFIGTVFASL